MDKPIDIDAACAGNPVALRQLRALRVVAAFCNEASDHIGIRCKCTSCSLFAELDAADAAARGER